MTGPTGNQGIQGERGVTGPQGMQGIPGPTGASGKDGTSVSILGSYNTIEELRTAHPTGNPGDAYLIGSDLYVWSSNSNLWENVGKIQGPTGPQGLQGERGVTGLQGPQGIQGITGPTGPQGLRGVTGPTGIQGPTGASGGISYNSYGMAHTTDMMTLKPNDKIPFNVTDRISTLMIALDGTITLSLTGTYLINWWISTYNLSSDPMTAIIDLKEIQPTPRILATSTSGKKLATNEATLIFGTCLVDVSQRSDFALFNSSKGNLFLNPEALTGVTITISKIN